MSEILSRQIQVEAAVSRWIYEGDDPRLSEADRTQLAINFVNIYFGHLSEFQKRLLIPPTLREEARATAGIGQLEAGYTPPALAQSSEPLPEPRRKSQIVYSSQGFQERGRYQRSPTFRGRALGKFSLASIDSTIGTDR